MPLSRSDAKFLLGLTLAGVGPAAAGALREMARRERGASDWTPQVYQALANILETAAKDPDRVADAFESAYDLLNNRRRVRLGLRR
jgi:hypothetical protein